jgi:hypothetical protein
MSMRWCSILILLLIAACPGRSVPTGAPCGPDMPCPRPLMCAEATSTCERTELDAAVRPPGDLPADPVDVTTGGMFTGDLNLAHDDAPQVLCDGGGGGRELFYKVSLSAPQVYYFDSFGSSFDSIMRAFPGRTCTEIAQDSIQAPSCSDDACGVWQSQLAVELPAGTSCIVVDQEAGETTGYLVLRVTPGGQSGTPLARGAQTLSGDTCGAGDSWTATECGREGGEDQAYFFTVCPSRTARVSASTCADPALVHFDTVLYVRQPGYSPGAALACNDGYDDEPCAARPDRGDAQADGSIINAEVLGPGVFFLVVDGYDAYNCGGWSMPVSLLDVESTP